MCAHCLRRALKPEQASILLKGKVSFPTIMKAKGKSFPILSKAKFFCFIGKVLVYNIPSFLSFKAF